MESVHRLSPVSPRSRCDRSGEDHAKNRPEQLPAGGSGLPEGRSPGVDPRDFVLRLCEPSPGDSIPGAARRRRGSVRAGQGSARGQVPGLPPPSGAGLLGRSVINLEVPSLFRHSPNPVPPFHVR